jgi:hypothetical protein
MENLVQLLDGLGATLNLKSEVQKLLKPTPQTPSPKADDTGLTTVWSGSSTTLQKALEEAEKTAAEVVAEAKKPFAMWQVGVVLVAGILAWKLLAWQRRHAALSGDDGAQRTAPAPKPLFGKVGRWEWSATQRTLVWRPPDDAEPLFVRPLSKRR